jgi:ABC-type transport system involved in multi-copper enzyme maturation permease subunit
MRSEWTKMHSTRAFYIQMGLALLLGIGLTALIGLAISSSWGEQSQAQRDEFDPLFVSAFGTAIAGIVLSVTGVTLISSEYTSGMIRLTMATSPRRLRVLFGKALVLTLVLLAIGLVVVVGSFFAGQAVLASNSDIPTTSLSDSAAQRAILAGWLTTPVFPLLGLAFGAILRSTASAITAIMAFMFVPGIFGGLLPSTLQENVLAYLPGSASDSLVRENDSILYLEPAVAAVVVIAWLAGVFALTSFLMNRRDV